jgi:hypothetical protein
VLLIMGGIFLMVGLLDALRDRGLARRVRLEGDSVLFMSRQTLCVPVSDIIGVRRGHGNLNRTEPVRFITLTQGTVRASARMRGLTELVAELRRLNPHVRLGDL